MWDRHPRHGQLPPHPLSTGLEQPITYTCMKHFHLILPWPQSVAGQGKRFFRCIFVDSFVEGLFCDDAVDKHVERVERGALRSTKTTRWLTSFSLGGSLCSVRYKTGTSTVNSVQSTIFCIPMKLVLLLQVCNYLSIFNFRYLICLWVMHDLKTIFLFYFEFLSCWGPWWTVAPSRQMMCQL